MILNGLRERLENSERTLHYATLGILSGLLVGMVILAFRMAIELPQKDLLISGILDDYESLSALQRLLLASVSGLVLGLLLWLSGNGNTRTGLVHVVDRVHNHHSVMPLRNALVQFIGGVIAILGGQSAGREGPAVHLGAAVNSWLCRLFKLPNNSLRILVGSGVAAAIAASFNTPIAGVIFAMEVVLMEYSVAGFIPVIAAAVTGTLITHTALGSAPALSIENISFVSLLELPWMALLGAACGFVAGLFIALQKRVTRFSHWHVVIRMSVAGMITGLIAIAVPGVMGLGYDSIQLAMAGQMGTLALLALIAAKIVATSISCGLGMPIGFIGPTFVIGACMGAMAGIGVAILQPELASPIGFYALLGIGACMAAVLNAPMAAIIAVIELTQSTHMIMPVMLTVITANVINSDVLRQPSLVSTMLATVGSRHQMSPMRNILQRMVVNSCMTKNVGQLPHSLSVSMLEAFLQEDVSFFTCKVDHQWYVFERNQINFQMAETFDSEQPTLQFVDSPRRAHVINSNATLLEAHQTLLQYNCDALAVFNTTFPQPVGVLSRKMLNEVIDIDRDLGQ